MRDGFIEDFQIWSPSETHNYPATEARPGGEGWRPSKYDMTTPFIQVPFIKFEYLVIRASQCYYTIDSFCTLVPYLEINPEKKLLSNIHKL